MITFDPVYHFRVCRFCRHAVMEEEFVYQVIAKGANYNITGVRVCSLLFVMFPVNPCGAKPFRASRSAGDDEDCINICLYHFILILGEDNRKEKFLKESSSNHSFFGENCKARYLF